MSIDRNTANANTQANVTTIQNAADANWIANVDSQINQAIAMGVFAVTAITTPQVNLLNVFQYYSNLGYSVFFPDFQNQNGGNNPSTGVQPADYFGYVWAQFWQGLILQNVVRNPARITISWSSGGPVPIEPV